MVILHTLTVNHASGHYPIFLGNHILESMTDYFSFSAYDRIFMVTDTHVYPLYGERIQNALPVCGMFLLPAGEQNKTLASVAALYSAFYEAGLTRSSLVIALGGGVVGDITGFAASSYLRGIAFVQVPTSFLAQIDSSIGGKTGVDLPFGKNMVGAFYPPKAVFADCTVLETLSPHYFVDGMGEAIKYGCIYDKPLFQSLQIKSYSLPDVIFRCMEIKKEVVEKDEQEQGVRMILNFGHTIGHAIEKCENFNGISHGMAVGIGMVSAARLSEGLQIAKEPVMQPICEALLAFGMPITTKIPLRALLDAIRADKKRNGDHLSFVLLEKIGTCVIKKLSFREIQENLQEQEENL